MADDQTRKSFDDAENESGQTFESQDLAPQADGPAGEQLSRHDGQSPQIPAHIVDDEAEELSGEPVEDRTPGHADPQDVVIDDQQQLADAEATAAKARSSRPVRRKRSSQSASSEATEPTTTSAEPTSASAEPTNASAEPTNASAEPVEAPRTSAPRPVRRPVKREAVAPQEAAVGKSSSSKSAARSRQATTDVHKRTTPAAFVGQSAAELRKVIWPTSSQLSQYFVVVLLFVLFIVAYVGLLDPAFGWVLLKFLGK